MEDTMENDNMEDTMENDTVENDIINDNKMDIDEEEQDTRPVVNILQELNQKTQNNLEIYNKAISKMNNILEVINNVNNPVYITISGTKRTFSEIIEDCANKSKQQINQGKPMNFGELLLEGLYKI